MLWTFSQQKCHSLVGGFKHFRIFHFINMGCHPSHWLSYFSKWLLHQQPAPCFPKCRGKIVGIRPKIYLANDGNYREMRWFTPWYIDPSKQGASSWRFWVFLVFFWSSFVMGTCGRNMVETDPYLENGPFIDGVYLGLPNLKMAKFPMAMLVITRWYPYIFSMTAMTGISPDGHPNPVNGGCIMS